MVVALIALFVALGGSAYAAINLPANSVGTKQLRTNAVAGAKISNNAVTSAKVKDGSLRATDFEAGQLPAGPRGPRGPAGLLGPKGDTGPAGTSASINGVAAAGDLTGAYPSLEEISQAIFRFHDTRVLEAVTS
jgi:hypothetical protein